MESKRNKHQWEQKQQTSNSQISKTLLFKKKTRTSCVESSTIRIRFRHSARSYTESGSVSIDFSTLYIYIENEKESLRKKQTREGGVQTM